MSGDQDEYNKWRCLIALAYVDGRLMREEQDFLTSKIEQYVPSGLQHRLLEEMREDMFNPKPPDLFFDLIQSPEERLDVLKKAYDLFWADGDLAEPEQQAFDRIIHEIIEEPKALALLHEKKEEWTQSADGVKSLRDIIEEKL